MRGKCAIAEDVCEGACGDAGSCWQGRATGGWTNGNSVGQTQCTSTTTKPKCGDEDFGDLGVSCTALSQCASGLCVGSNSSFICVKRCSSTDQCPAGWVCGQSATLGFPTCFIGAPEHTGLAVSTNSACAQVAFTDIGAQCQFGTDCQSGICFGSSVAGYFCSRRCNDDSLCAMGFRCVTSTADSAKFCEKI